MDTRSFARALAHHWTPAVLTALALATPAAAQVVDQGVVIVDPDDHLRIGVDAFGQRDVIGVADGPYSAITVGEGIDGDGTLNVNGGNVTSDGEFQLSHGTVHVSNSGSLATGTTVFSTSCCVGPQTVTVEGTGSSWINSGQLDLGRRGDYANARVKLLGGATGETSGLTTWSAGGPLSVSVELDGVGTEYVNFGDLVMGRSTVGHDTVAVTGGARYSSPGALKMGEGYAGSRVLVSGLGSTFEVGSARLSGLGAESVRVSAGGHLITGDAELYSQTTSRVFIEDPGSRWTVNGELRLAFVGAGGSNVLSILNGAVVASTSGLVTTNTDSTVTISGNGSEWNVSETLEVRGSSRSRILVEAGGLLTSGPTIVGTTGCSSPHIFRDCVIAVDGPSSRWTGSATLSVGSPGNADAVVRATNGGQIAMASSITVAPGGFFILEDGSVEAASLDLAGGQLSGVGMVDAPITNGGSVHVGSGDFTDIGDLHVTDTYTQLSTGTLDITLADANGDVSDRLMVDQDAILAGILNVSALPTYAAELGDTFDLIVADEIVGEFDQVVLPALQNALYWQLEYVLDPVGTDSLRLRAVPEPGTAVLFGLGMAITAAGRKRRNAKMRALNHAGLPGDSAVP